MNRRNMKKIFILIIISCLVFGYSNKFKENITYNMTNIHKNNFKIYKTLYIGDSKGDKYYSYQENKINPLASLTKLMTAQIIFDDINSGKYSLNSNVNVGEIFLVLNSFNSYSENFSFKSEFLNIKALFKYEDFFFTISTSISSALLSSIFSILDI